MGTTSGWLVPLAGLLVTGTLSAVGLAATWDPYRRVRQAVEVHGKLKPAHAVLWEVVVLTEITHVISREPARRRWAAISYVAGPLAPVSWLAALVAPNMRTTFMTLGLVCMVVQGVAVAGVFQSRRKGAEMEKRISEHVDRQIDRSETRTPGHLRGQEGNVPESFQQNSSHQ